QELIDERLDDRSLIPGLARAQRVPHQGPEREAANPLRRPIRANLPTRDAPNFFRIRFEENLEQTPAKAIRNPRLEVIFGLLRKQPREQVAHRTMCGLPDAQTE